MSDVLDTLPDDWCIYRDGAGWSVGKIDDDFECGGYSVSWLADGATPAAAITAARARVEQDEREDEERRADYARRKAAGELTSPEMMMELANEYAWRAFAPKFLEMIATPIPVFVHRKEHE